MPKLVSCVVIILSWIGLPVRGRGTKNGSAPSPRGGRDPPGQPSAYRRRYFNPPSPWGEGQAVLISIRPEWVFQSTLPVWGGTKGEPTRRPKADRFQSTLPARGGTKLNGSTIVKTLISIHPPRVGRDHAVDLSGNISPAFQSTLPVWGGTFVALK